MSGAGGFNLALFHAIYTHKKHKFLLGLLSVRNVNLNSYAYAGCVHYVCPVANGGDIIISPRAVFRSLVKIIIPPPVWNVSFVCVHPSVLPSVRLSVRPSRTLRITREPKSVVCPNSERRFPTFDATCRPVLKVKRSKIKVTRPINTNTHRAQYLPNDKAHKLQTWCTDGGRRPASATGVMTSKVKGQGRKVT